MKLCRACNTEFPETEFYRDTSRPDGLNWRCKQCHKAHVARVSMLPPKITNAPEGMKRCGRCKETKPLADFFAAKGRYDGKQQTCKACQTKRHKEWSAKNPGYSARKHKEARQRDLDRYADYGRKKMYGMAPGQYAKMLAEQNGRCAICGTDDPSPRRNFAVDHCHEEGHIRGLLCGRCNTGIGQLRHSETILLSAINYIRTSNPK